MQDRFSSRYGLKTGVARYRERHRASKLETNCINFGSGHSSEYELPFLKLKNPDFNHQHYKTFIRFAAAGLRRKAESAS